MAADIDLDELAFAGAAAQLEAMGRGATTSRALTEAALRRIERLDPRLNAFRVVLAEEALDAADRADARRAAGERAALLGVPIAIKDDVEQAGQVTTFGTGAPFAPATVESEVLVRLRDAGAVVVGRTNGPELLIWPFTASRTWGVTRNPWDLDRTPGGSSGGSAAAVAAGIVGVALGSDGGGSIRIPAACCGIFGLKPTRDLVPIAPHTDADHAWLGLGVYGPLARSVLDAALFLDATAEPDGGPPYADAAYTHPGPLRIAMALRPPLPGRVDGEVLAATRAMADTLRGLGHTVTEVSPAYLRAVPDFMVRYLGGIARSADALPRHELFEERTRRMAAVGRAIPGLVVMRVRRHEAAVTASLGEAFRDADVLLTPALAAPPVPAGRWASAGALRTFAGVAQWTPFAQPWNVTGQPAAAVPAGRTRGGLPLAVQLVAPHHGERTLLALAAQIERERPWSQTRPPLR